MTPKQSLFAAIGVAVLISLVVIFATSGGNESEGKSTIGDPVAKGLGNTGYDVEKYSLELTWNQEEEFLDGVATISADALQELAVLYLDLDGLQASQVTVDSEDASFEQQGRELQIEPADPITASSAFEIVVSYSGTPVPTELGIFESGWQISGDSVFVLGQPRGASTWYPSNDHPSDKALFELAISVDREKTVASNGDLISITPTPQGLSRWQFQMNQPIATYLTTLVIGDYDVVEGAAGAAVPIRNVFPAEAEEDERDVFDAQDEMLEVFVDLFGPYPFDSYGSVLLEAGPSGALETQTLSVFGRGVDAEKIVAHELAHQWFGNSVSLTEFNDIWLNEGFATYSQFLWQEFGLDQDIEQAITNELAVAGINLEDPPGKPTETEEGIFDFSIYLRGSLVLHAVRLEVGDEAFFEILKTYASEFKYSNATTEDFIELSERVSGQDLDPVFDIWLYEEGLPNELGGIDLTPYG